MILMNQASDVTDKGNQLPKVSKLLPFKPIGLRYSAVELLLALLIFLVAAAFAVDLPYGKLIQSILLTLGIISAVFAIVERAWSLIVALVLVIPALIGKCAHNLYPDSFPFMVYLIATKVFLYIMGNKLFGFILHARKDDLRVLCFGLSGYLMLGLIWIPEYILVANLDQGVHC